jgi:mannosyltransferase
MYANRRIRRDHRDIRIPAKWIPWLLLLAIVLVGSFLRIYLLGALSIWYDEMFSIVVAKNSLSGVVTAAATSDVHPPLYYFLLHYWILAFGESDVVIRLLSAIFGIFAIPMVYLVGRTIFSEEIGLVAAFVTAVSPLNVYYSQEARMYSLLVLLTLLSMYFFILLMRGTYRITLYIGYVIATILLLYAHAYGFFVVFAQNIYFFTLLILRNLPRAGVKRWIALQCVVALSFVPWILTLLGKLPVWAEDHSGAMPPAVSALFYTLQIYAGTTLLLAVFLVLCGLLVAASVYPRRPAETTTAEPVEKTRLSPRVPLSLASYLCLVWLLTLNVVPFLISQRLPGMYSYRYAIAASVPLYLFVAKGVSIIRVRSLKLAVIGVIAFLAISAIYHVPIPELQGTHVGIGVPKAPVREAVDYINKNAESGDLIVFSPFWDRYFFFHYANRSVAILGLPAYDEESSTMALQALANATNAHNRIWLIEDDSPNYSELRMLATQNLTNAYHTSYNASYGTGFGRWQVYLFER